MPRQPVPLTQKLRAGQAVCVASCNPAGYTPDLVDYLGPTGLDGVWIATCAEIAQFWLETGWKLTR